MNLSSRFLSFTLVGAEWVLWLLVVLSVISLAIMIERLWFFQSHREDVAQLVEEIRKLLGAKSFDDAHKKVSTRDTVISQVARAGVAEATNGPDAAAEAMVGAKARERLRLERNLAFLGTLGNNAPFIGLFGTVLGIIKAFHDLAANQAGGVGVVMAGISEALVATAVGLLVAIPAVVAFNYFNRRVRAQMAGVDELMHVVLSQLKAVK